MGTENGGSKVEGDRQKDFLLVRLLLTNISTHFASCKLKKIVLHSAMFDPQGDEEAKYGLACKETPVFLKISVTKIYQVISNRQIDLTPFLDTYFISAA